MCSVVSKDAQPEQPDEVKESNKTIFDKSSEKRRGKSALPESSSVDDDHLQTCGSWDNMFERLQAFKKKEGSCLIPSSEEDAPLASWVEKQRQVYQKFKSSSKLKKNAKVSANDEIILRRIARLNKTGFPWTKENNTGSKKRSNWETRFEELLHFVVNNGHTQVPIGWEENVPLSNWVSAQRQGYKSLQKGRYSRLTQARIDMLNSVGFVWEAPKGGPKRQINEGEPIPQTFRAILKSPPPEYLQERAKSLLDVLAQRREKRTGDAVVVDPSRDANFMKHHSASGSAQDQKVQTIDAGMTRSGDVSFISQETLELPKEPQVVETDCHQLSAVPHVGFQNYYFPQPVATRTQATNNFVRSHSEAASVINFMQQQQAMANPAPTLPNNPLASLFQQPAFGLDLARQQCNPQQLQHLGTTDLLTSLSMSTGLSPVGMTTNMARTPVEELAAMIAAVRSRQTPPIGFKKSSDTANH